MDPAVQAAYVAGVIALVGILAAGLGYLVRAHREDRHRFTDLKREKYALLLGLSDRHRQAVMDQRQVVFDALAQDREPEHVPELGTTNQIEAVVDEIRLLAPDAVVDAALDVLEAVFRLGQYAYDRVAPPPFRLHRAERIEGLPAAEFRLVAARHRFRLRARDDLGMPRNRWGRLSPRPRPLLDAHEAGLLRLKYTRPADDERGPGTDKVGR